MIFVGNRYNEGENNTLLMLSQSSHDKDDVYLHLFSNGMGRTYNTIDELACIHLLRRLGGEGGC